MSNWQEFAQFLAGEVDSGAQAATFARAEWEQWFSIARRADLLALLHDRIGQADIELPADLRQTLRDQARQATAESLRKRAELTRVLGALNGAGIIPILFKGAVLAHTVYPSYTLRPMGDIDLWVARQQMDRAQAVLASIGYVYKEKAHRSHALQALGDGELQMRGQTSMLGLVELHYGVFAGEWMRIVTRIDRTAVYDRLVACTILDQPALCLAPEDAFIQIALHVGINHQLTINGLRSLVDLEFLSRQGVDWRIVAQRCREWRVYTAVSFVIDLWHRLFATACSAQAAAAMPFHRAALLHLFVRPNDLLAGHDLARSRWRLLYQLSLIDRGRDAAKLIAHTLWPDRSWLQARYDDARPWTRLQHFKQVVSGKM